MKVVITGTSQGIGRETAKAFVSMGHEVFGLDKEPATIEGEKYVHCICDVSKPETLPDILGVDIVVNNAGTIDEAEAIDTNLVGYINVVEKYCFQQKLKCLINVASISGHVGLDTMRYAASQGGRLALSKHLAITLGNAYGARVVSISPGAVLTNLEPNLYKSEKLVKAVANENLLKKWITPNEIAQWIYFVACVDKSMTGQDILIDNGEVANYNFISSKEDANDEGSNADTSVDAGK